MDAIREVGGVECLQARLYESDYSHCKITYGKTFKRASSSMAKAIEKKHTSMQLDIRKAE